MSYEEYTKQTNNNSNGKIIHVSSLDSCFCKYFIAIYLTLVKVSSCDDCGPTRHGISVNLTVPTTPTEDTAQCDKSESGVFVTGHLLLYKVKTIINIRCITFTLKRSWLTIMWLYAVRQFYCLYFYLVI